MSVDGSFVEANAAKESRIPRQQLAEAAQVNHTVRQYLVELEQQNPMEEPVHQQDQVSTTDPDSTYATKGGTPAPAGLLRQLSGGQCQLRDRRSASDGSTHESRNCGRARHAHALRTVAGTRTLVGSRRCHVREWGVLQWLLDRGITPYMRTRDSSLRKNSPFFGPECFTYLPESNSYRCPAGEQLNYVGLRIPPPGERSSRIVQVAV